TGGGTDELRKRAPESPMAGPEGEALQLIRLAHDQLGKVEGTGERLVDLQKSRVPAGSRRPAGAINEAHDAADRPGMGKAAGAEISGARIGESEQLAEALHKFPVKPAGWNESRRLTALEPGAEELGAAACEAANGSSAWLERLHTEAVAKAFRRDRL